nr:immunoglobulin heavy chain junction region [Macaca mulatta]
CARRRELRSAFDFW